MASGGDGDLSKYELEGVEEIKKEDGSKPDCGSYGFVFEVKFRGEVFMAKKPHTVLLRETTLEERSRVASKFREECILLSQLKHRNIVQFIGVYYDDVNKTDLILVMEKLHSDLVSFLANNPQSDLSLKLSILRDVAKGLEYLHGHHPAVVHRDLTAMNILLTDSNRAKIADVGMSKLMDSRAMMATRHTRVPGQQFYMPPETKFEKAECTPKLDIFSFGHLILHIIIEDFPEVYDIPHSKKKEGIIEQQKRDRSLQVMGSSHCLYDLTLSCLRDDPKKRPSAPYILEGIESLPGSVPIAIDPQQDTTMGDISSPESDGSLPEINIVIAGLPRTGKSTGLNNIFNLDLPEGPVTDKVVSKQVSRNDITFTVTATPGLTAANANKDKIVMRDVKNVGVQKTLLLILTLPVSPGSCITENYCNILKNLTEIFGKDIWKWSLVLLTYSDIVRNEFQDEQAYQDYLKEHCMELQKVLRSIGIEKPVKLFFDYTSFDHFRDGTLDGIVALPVGKEIEVPTERLYPLQPWTHRYRWPDLALMEIIKINKDIPDASKRRAAFLLNDEPHTRVTAAVRGAVTYTIKKIKDYFTRENL